MNVVPAWQKGYTGKGVTVSILDDGIEKDHPDLKKNYVSRTSLLPLLDYPFTFCDVSLKFAVLTKRQRLTR